MESLAGGTADNEPTVSIVGEIIALGPLRRDLVPTYHRWHNAIATTRTFALSQPTTVEQEEASFRELTTDRHMKFFTIYERVSWRVVGTAYLAHIDYLNSSAEFGILIGEEDSRGQGYGTEATQLTLDFAFTALGLHSIMLTVYEYNAAGRRSYEKAGFREFGRRHESRRMGGRFWDEIYMECLATEFVSPVLARIFVPDVPRR